MMKLSFVGVHNLVTCSRGSRGIAPKPLLKLVVDGRAAVGHGSWVSEAISLGAALIFRKKKGGYVQPVVMFNQLSREIASLSQRNTS